MTNGLERIEATTTALRRCSGGASPPTPTLETALPQPITPERVHHRDDDFPEIIGQSAGLSRILATVRTMAPRNVPVLIRGESGTGKELIARALHRLSPRHRQMFVSENCAALSESLLEAELFGCEAGAYTGAPNARAGLIERAHGGTLFLDEIGEMTPGLQSKLLRTLQEREVRRLGSTQVVKVDFRLLSATHRDLEEEVERGRFRQDLLYRLNVVTVEMPALRERREDIPLLVHYFLRQLAARHQLPIPEFASETMKTLSLHSWPGNIRQLRNEIERVLMLCPDFVPPSALSFDLNLDDVAMTDSAQLREAMGPDLRSIERILIGGVIRDVLRESGGNKTEAARKLGMPKTSLYRRLRRYGISLDAL